MVRRLIWCFVAWACLGVGASGQERVTLAWDANPPGDGTIGYRVLFGTAPGIYPQTRDAGNVTEFTVESLSYATPHYLVLVAYDAQGQVSGHSNMVAHTTQAAPLPPVGDPRCVPPLGNRSVSVFVTNLQLTGSRGAGSRARLDFQLASPNSPVVSVEARANGVPVATMAGTDLNGLAGIWFTVPTPPAAYALSVSATNAYGCTRVQPSTLVVTVK